MSDITAAGPHKIDITKEGGVDLLQGKAVGLIGVLFLTVTGAAPMTAMLGNVPVTAVSNGPYTPAAFLLATIVLTIFSIGYAAMARKVSAVGGFYSFISQGLGREVGMSAGLASFASYSVFEASLTGIFAFFANSWLKDHFGIDIPWVYLSLFMIALAGLLSYLDVRLSAGILGVALVCEVIVLVIFNIGVMMAPSGTSFTLDSLNLIKLFTVPVAAQKVGDVDIAAGAAAVGIFMAFWSWVGFEMAPNYAEESKDPKRVIPLSLYFSVVGLGLFYIWTSWCSVAAFPTAGDMLVKATKDSGNFFIAPLGQFVGPWAAQAMGVLIMTSAFACGMAFHNTAARYLYSLAREGVLPSALASTHDSFKSPHVASVLQTVLAAIWVSLFAYFLGTNDPNSQAYLGVYTLLAILGTLLLLILQAVVSIAIVVYFRTHHGDEAGVVSTLIAPIIAFAAQTFLVYLLISNIEALGGDAAKIAFFKFIPIVTIAILVVGLIWGFVLKAAAPKVYERIGRMVFED